MPASTTHMNLFRIACNSCGGSPAGEDVGDALAAAAGTASSGADSAAMLKDLNFKIRETEATASYLTNEVYARWTSMFNNNQELLKRLHDFVAKHLTITVDGGTTLTEDEKNLVQILLQASNLVYFLEKEETQAAYGTKADSLADLKGRLAQVVCASRQLLAKFSDKDIRGFVQRNVYQSLKMAGVTNEGIRRAVCAVALKYMTTILSTVDLPK
ncbi:hypothetical protein EGW08_019425 [Elysia chlorotica]|uniref:Uncharacterized protein n=1 Tax=Elysia chlorotica TaxID=188477 RepID=A0A3S0Z806_ELYCH|nr:hypothetical protein EGW08_019425 [Elysia chlorotica]